MTRWYGLHSLAVKLSLIFSLVVAACAAFLAVTGYVDGRDVLEREAKARYESIVTSLAFNAEYGVLTRNIPVLDQVAGGVTREEDVNFVQIADANGDVLAGSGQRREPGALVSKPVLTRRVSNAGDAEFLFGGVEAPAGLEEASMERLGAVTVEFNTAFIQKKLAKMGQRAALISLLTVLIGVLVTAFLSRILILPLQDLVHAAGRVAQGDLSHKVSAKSKDEIGELAHVFNVMTASLNEFTVSRDYLDSLLDAIPDAILVAGEDGKIITVNDGALRLSGRKEEDVLGSLLQSFLSLEESQVKPRDGFPIPVSISQGRLSSDDGRPLGTVYVAHDVRPLQKLQDRLLQTEKMAAVGQLAAGVAHEINNPLGVILGFAQGLCRRLEPGHPTEVPLRSIEREAMRCKDLVQDLLTFSRASHAEREPIDLNAAVEGALSLIQAQARMDSAGLKRTLAPGLPRVSGSKSQLQQVIINLAKNALDAMPKGGTLTVSTELEETPTGSWVCLRVRDEGTGIPADVLPRIFDPFFTTKPVGKGTGLGLALVYEIVKKHSGLVDVKSRPGDTEFIVKFPVRTGREADRGELADA